jgi:hypothetical protein
VAVAGEPHGVAEHVLPAFEVALRRLELVLGRVLGDADAVLLRLRQIERDRIRLEGLQELASLLGQLCERPSQDDRRSEASACRSTISACNTLKRNSSRPLNRLMVNTPVRLPSTAQTHPTTIQTRLVP